MALTVLTLSCFLFYSTSKYFPFEGIQVVKKHRLTVVVLASAIALLSLYLFTIAYDFATALMFWSVALMTLLSAVVLSLKMNKKWIWAWSSLSLIFIILDIL